jgi:hypothetical protein
MEVGVGVFLLGVMVTLGGVGVATWKLWSLGLVHFGRPTLASAVQVHINNGSAPRGDEEPTASGSGPSRWN